MDNDQCACGIHQGKGYQCHNDAEPLDDLCVRCYDLFCTYEERRCE